MFKQWILSCCDLFPYRAVGSGGYNVPPLVELGLTNLPKTGEYMPPSAGISPAAWKFYIFVHQLIKTCVYRSTFFIVEWAELYWTKLWWHWIDRINRQKSVKRSRTKKIFVCYGQCHKIASILKKYWYNFRPSQSNPEPN